MHIFGSSKGATPAAGGASAGNIPFVTEKDFEQVVILSENAVVVQFTSERSQPCKATAPEVEAFAAEVEGKIGVVKVDIDRSPALAQQLRIQSVPTFMLFYNQRLGDV